MDAQLRTAEDLGATLPPGCTQRLLEALMQEPCTKVQWLVHGIDTSLLSDTEVLRIPMTVAAQRLSSCSGPMDVQPCIPNEG